MNPKIKANLLKILYSAIVIALAILLALGLDSINMRSENIFLTFVVAVLLIIIQNKNIYYGIASSVILVMAFNFLFITPKYTFNIEDPNYLLSLLFFLLVTSIVGSLVSRLQRQVQISKQNTTEVKTLYEMTTNLLNSHNTEEIYKMVCSYLKDYLNREVGLLDLNGNFYGQIEENYQDFQKEIKYSLDRNIIVGFKENKFPELSFKIFPIKNKKNKFGTLCVSCGEQSLTDNEKRFIINTINHLIVSLEREEAIKLQLIANDSMQREKFRSQLLRGLSHDLKTPLTSIQGGSNLLLESFDEIDDKVKKEVIQDIYVQSCDLYNFVQNLLNMTKFDEKKKLIDKKFEVVDDIFSVVSDKVKMIKTNKKIIYVKSDEIITVNTQTELLVQTLFNLIDNAIQHTKKGTTITVKYYKDKDDVVFEVIDNGGGVDEAIKTKIFEMFYSIVAKQDYGRSTGLGLSICKAIVEAHGGKITCENNDIGGATFRFNIPNKEKKGNE